MLSLTPSLPTETEGDFRRRKAVRASCVFFMLFPLTLALYIFGGHLWAIIASSEGFLFWLGALGLGLVIAFLPFVALAAGWWAIWNGVESVWLPRSRKTPFIDRLLIVVAFLVFFSPALAFCSMALQAVMSGAVSFRRPVAHEYLLATDPTAFWQGVGFLLIVAGVLAYPAVQYWKSRLAQAKQNHAE